MAAVEAVAVVDGIVAAVAVDATAIVAEAETPRVVEIADRAVVATEAIPSRRSNNDRSAAWRRSGLPSFR